VIRSKQVHLICQWIGDAKWPVKVHKEAVNKANEALACKTEDPGLVRTLPIIAKCVQSVALCGADLRAVPST